MKFKETSKFELQFAGMLDKINISYVQQYALTDLEMAQLPSFMQPNIKRSISRFRYDFMLPDHKLIFEIDGGLFSGGRHIHALGYIKDRAKYLVAFLCGYHIISLPTNWFKAKRYGKASWHSLTIYELSDFLGQLKK